MQCMYTYGLRIIDYYVENFLECDCTYDRERGIVQTPRAVKVGALSEYITLLI